MLRNEKVSEINVIEQDDRDIFSQGDADKIREKETKQKVKKNN